MNKMKKIEYLISLPKTIFFNFKAFKFCDAVKLRIIINYKTKFGKIYKNVIIFDKENNEKVWFGFGGSDGIFANNNYISMDKNSKIKFYGKAVFGKGIVLRSDGGNLEIGKNFSTNKNCSISCKNEISIGENVLFGWNIHLMDSNGHKIFKNNIKDMDNKKISIGNHVWVCSYSDILKGTKINDDSIVAYKSCVNKEFIQNNIVIGGIPAKVVAENVNWEK